MRKWYKYNVVIKDALVATDHNGFSRFAEQMNGYQADEAYDNRHSFFKRYLDQEGYGRLLIYDNFLRLHLKPSMRILSIASGRAANELALIEDGFNITCSDLEIPDCIEATRLLFDHFSYEKLNILEAVTQKPFNMVISLSLIYNFDSDQLDLFFSNISKLLGGGDMLILDYVGAPDNVWTWLLHDIYLRVESWAYAMFKSVIEFRGHTVSKELHGYRRSNQDVQLAAARFGLTLKDYKEGGELLDFHRGVTLPRLMKFKIVRVLLSQIGRCMPYVRMGLFVKENIREN